MYTHPNIPDSVPFPDERQHVRTMFVLTVEAGEVGPVKQRAVEGGDGEIVEEVCAIGVAQCVCKQVHLE